jgi:hypothetical protein
MPAACDGQFRPTVILSGTHRQLHSSGGHLAYAQYVRFLYRKSQELVPVEEYAQGYMDHLQQPLQPLMDNLEGETYEGFEKDPIKYRQYEEAAYRALLDRPQGMVTCVTLSASSTRRRLISSFPQNHLCRRSGARTACCGLLASCGAGTTANLAHSGREEPERLRHVRPLATRSFISCADSPPRTACKSAPPSSGAARSSLSTRTCGASTRAKKPTSSSASSSDPSATTS